MNGEDKKELKVKIKGGIRDLIAFAKLVPKRRKRFQRASSEPITSDPINEFANKLHPKKQHLIIDEIRDETKSTKTIKAVPDLDSGTNSLAYFRPGQYLSLKVEVNGVRITRPYSISSSPTDALKGFYEITIRKVEDGFLTTNIWDKWKVGKKITCSDPEGFFYYEPLRDKNHIVAIAGGSGIAPFRSMAKEIIETNIDVKLTLIYGSADEEDIIFYEEFKELEKTYPNKIKVVIVLSCDEVNLEGCETGFITANLIKKYIDANECSFFICGPQIMYDFVENQLKEFNLPPKRIRREAYGEVKEIINLSGFPKEVADNAFKIKVHIGSLIEEIPAKASETILVALEKANLNPPSSCRSGECGFCRSLLISGKIYVNPISDWRRAADKKFNFFHPCSSYPVSDLEIKIPRTR